MIFGLKVSKVVLEVRNQGCHSIKVAFLSYLQRLARTPSNPEDI